MNMLLSAIALMIAAPAVAQTSPTSQAAHNATPAAADVVKAGKAEHPVGCHLMNGKMIAMKDGKMVPCPEEKSNRPRATNPHAAHDSIKH